LPNIAAKSKIYPIPFKKRNDMRLQSDNIPVWVITNGWREIFARLFEGEQVQLNLTPEWLVNPETKRRLKLDMLYPDLGVAVRFEGLQSKQRRTRLSLEEEAQLRVRHDARLTMCEVHGISLIVIDLIAGEVAGVFQEIDTVLSRAVQRSQNKALSAKLKQLRTAAAMLSRKINTLVDLKLYADLWQDRQYQVPEVVATPQPKQAIAYREGMSVEHATFGPGVVIKTTSSDGDTLITVDFITAGQKTLAASLVAGKLLPR
jgi:hypothetical protein